MVYVASGLGGSGTRWAHSKKPPALRRRPDSGRRAPDAGRRAADSGRRESSLGAIGVKVTFFSSPSAIPIGKMDQPGASNLASFQPSPNWSVMVSVHEVSGGTTCVPLYGAPPKMSTIPSQATVQPISVENRPAVTRITDSNQVSSGPTLFAPSSGLHLPWISTPLAVVLTTYSSASS